LYNKLLYRLVTKHLGDGYVIPIEYQTLFNSIAEALEHCDKDRKMLERTIELCSDEMVELHSTLRAEKAELEKKNAELSMVFNNIEEVVFSVDMQRYTVTHMSEYCYTLYGYPPENFIEDNSLWMRLIHDDDQHIVEHQVAELSAGKTITNEYRIIHKNGETKWIENKVIPTLDEYGKLVRIDGTSKDVTHRKLADIKLQQSRELMADAQRMAKFGSWEMILSNTEDIAKNPIKWSEEVYRILGFNNTNIDVTYDDFLGLLHPEDQSAVIRAIYQTFNNPGQRNSIDYRIVLQDSQVRWIDSAWGLELGDDNSKPARLVGTVQDITSRKYAELRLAETKAHFRNILENSDTAYVLLDRNAQIVAYNNLAMQLALDQFQTNLKPGLNYVELMHGTRREEVEIKIGQVLSQRNALRYEVLYYSQKHGDTWLQVSMHPIVTEYGVVTGLSIGAINISERKRIEESIRLNNERYELVMKATNDVIWDWDVISDSLFRSDNFYDLTGYSQAEFQHIDSWITLIHQDDKERVKREISNALENEKSIFWESEYRIIMKNGDLAFIHDKGYILREDDTPVRMVGAMTNMTQSKQAEIEREKITNDLIAQKNDLEQFAFIVSHNLRSPVANLMAYSDSLLLFDDLTTEERITILKEINTSTTRLDSVIQDLNQILHVKRQLQDRKEPIILEDLVEDIRSSISELFEKNKVRLTYNFIEVQNITSIRSYIHSIFYNLISNSIKYHNPNRIPEINILGTKTRDGLLLTFTDNGLGMDMDALNGQLFGLYKRFHSTHEGKGVGLFMTKSQVTSLGGKIEVESEIGVGTTFKIYLND